MKYTVSQLKKMNSQRLDKVAQKLETAPKSKTAKTTLQRIERILEARYS